MRVHNASFICTIEAQFHHVKTYSYQDIEDYYDQTEVHYRMWWKLDRSLGLHYGVWNQQTKNLAEAILNLNRELCELGQVQRSWRVLDAGCGIGGSSFYLAEHFACETEGVTLSRKQVETAQRYARDKGFERQCQFRQCSYTDTPFEEHHFDAAWAVESLGSAQDKGAFFKEMHRLLKPGGRILIADTLKPRSYDIQGNQVMQTMLNGWAISDILSIDELKQVAEENGFKFYAQRDVSPEIKKSVRLIYVASLFGMIGTKVYNAFKRASRFSRIHYTTGLAQKKAYDKGDWKYILIVFEKA
jgi:tocopherol O-methyltransferase